MQKRKRFIMLLIVMIGLHLSFFDTSPSLAAASKNPGASTIYCKIGILKDHDADHTISIDFIFNVYKEQKIQDATELISKIGIETFFREYLKNDKIYFCDRNGVIRKIFDIHYKKKDLEDDSDRFFITGKLKNADDVYKAQPDRYSAYLGCNIKDDLIFDIEYLTDVSGYLVKDQELVRKYSEAKDKIAIELISKLFSKSEYRLIETNIQNNGWLVDLDNNGVKEVVSTPKIHLGLTEPRTTCASLIIFYKNGHYKTQIDFGQKNQHLYNAQIIGVIDYDKNGTKELVISCKYYESFYYIIIDEGQKDNKIIFSSHTR